jgi:hypothetical protein
MLSPGKFLLTQLNSSNYRLAQDLARSEAAESFMTFNTSYKVTSLSVSLCLSLSLSLSVSLSLSLCLSLSLHSVSHISFIRTLVSLVSILLLIQLNLMKLSLMSQITLFDHVMTSLMKKLKEQKINLKQIFLFNLIIIVTSVRILVVKC